MSINLSLLILAGLGAFAIGYGAVMDKTSSFDNSSFMYQILLIAVGVVAIVGAVFMKLVFSVV